MNEQDNKTTSESAKDKSAEIIDLRVIIGKIAARKRLFMKVLPATFVIACAYILCVPRTYDSSLSLAPEVSNSSGIGGTLGTLASSFGFDIGNMETTDAINPMLYPDLMGDNGFVVGKDITITVDKKTALITISTTAQDPLVCKILADSVKERLQVFITNYRTSKARIDEKYYRNLVAEAKRDYEQSRRKYGSYADANTDVVLTSIRAKQDDMENDMQLKYNAYSALMTQYQAAKAKVQERTPAFTVVKGASVPLKPTGPKRMLFVIGMCVLAVVVLSIYSIKDLIVK